MDTRNIEIVPLEKTSAGRAVSMLTEAFIDEPGAVAVTGSDPEKRRRLLRIHFAVEVDFNLAQAVSKCAFFDGELVGVMLLSAPGKKSATNIGMFQLLWRMLFHASPAVIWRGLRSSMDDESHRPKEPNYYLETLAVDPEFQGRGIGGSMLSCLTGLADRDGVLTYLSTTDPRTLPLYEKHGFAVKAETNPIGALNYHMEREPGGDS